MRTTRMNEHSNLIDLLALGTPLILPFRQRIAVGQEHTPSIYYVEEGLVQLCRPVGDETVNLLLAAPGDFLTIGALTGATHVEDYACALEDSVVIRLEKKTVDDAIFDQPALATLLIQMILMEHRDMQDRLCEMQCHAITPRLAASILRHANLLGKRSQGSVDLRRFTHEYWAQEIGTSREVVTNSIGILAREGAVTQPSRRSLPMRVFFDKLRAICNKSRKRGPMGTQAEAVEA